VGLSHYIEEAGDVATERRNLEPTERNVLGKGRAFSAW
jgi:hypothetical protein